MWDLSSPTKDRTCAPCIGRWSLNHWTAGEVPRLSLLKYPSIPCLGSGPHNLLPVPFTQPRGLSIILIPALGSFHHSHISASASQSALETLRLISLCSTFNHSIIQQTCTEHPPCFRHCSGYLGHISN